MEHKEIVKVKVLKDLPGVKAGEEFKLGGSGIIAATGYELRGANIGPKWYYSSEYSKYPEFFEVFYETKEED